ncbi:hypothetical protein GQ43DRAFT_313833 [Delitschia confertaspora ATCC 74209]|uniref:Stress response protein NST1 n=1 Tax=Delitschia confertaspora ATCC 74209 TaxID=1513339 RepID=A0A9P4JNJ8_9PLEO|nr:hypothetical protein GQ43DRAFT_313833 [Delitschia confertaspora ATCC 74209]
MAQGTKGQAAASATPSNGIVGEQHAPAPAGVNRKKQKRREKQAAKQAAEAQKQTTANAKNGHHPSQAPTSTIPQQPPSGQPAPNYEDQDYDGPDNYDHAEGDYYSDDDGQNYEQPYAPNGNYAAGYSHTAAHTGTGKKSKKKKKTNSYVPNPLYDSPSAVAHRHHQLPHPPQPSTAGPRKGNKDRIWNTSTSEERERIKEFWLSLGEDERKSLVKIEKEAVLRKMKEQQKHSCSCTVCGRKRTAIEEELEVLYDAYYEELEQYANHQQDGTPMLPPTSRYAHALSSMPPGRPIVHPPNRVPSRIQELADDESEDEEDEEGDEDDYSEDYDDEDDISDDEPMEIPRGAAADFFNFGNSLTVKGGILTVADDLLKNDGKKFIEMMEQLAERRMQREEEAQYAAASMSHPSMYSKGHSHNHAPPPEEEEYDDEEEEDYDDDEEYEDDEEDEGDTMTEEQRMEEGRRMFQIFAARMFEQRVLTAYREKVAAERQQRLLEELAEEDEKKDQREAKKAKEAQKRKEKKEKQKAAKAEEKARKDAEKAAQEAAAKAAEEKRLEEQRKKKEEQRKKKEAERKALEEERQRKEAERLKRQQEERERQQEAERKAREQKALEKKAREEAKKKEREEREAREKEAREKKAQEEKERREREAKAKVEKERLRKEEQAASQGAHPKRSSQPIPVALPPGLLKQTSSTGVPSPHVTPAVPKAPTPNRPRQSSQQGSHGSSPKTPQVAPRPGKSISPSQATQLPPNIAPKQILTKPSTAQPSLTMHHPQPLSPMPPLGPPPGMHPPGMGMPNLPPGLNGYPHGQVMMPGMMGPRHPNQPMFPPQSSTQGFRPFPPPGMHAPNPMALGRGFMDGPPGFGPVLPGMGATAQMSGFGMGMPSHSRQASGSLDKPTMEPPIVAPQAQPIARPAPIQRPSSTKPLEENRRPYGSDVDELADHLGSKALLDDTDDVPELPQGNEARRTSVRAPGLPGTNPLGFGFPDAPGHPRSDSYPSFSGISSSPSAWTTPPIGFPMGGAHGWGNSPTTASMFSNPFAMRGAARQSEPPRLVTIRRIVCNICKALAARQPSQDGYYDVNDICEQAQTMRAPAESQITTDEIIEACDIFGDASNGGGSLEYKEVPPNSRRYAIKFEESGGPTAALGEIGSPLPGHSIPANTGFGGPRPFPSLGSIHSPNF